MQYLEKKEIKEIQLALLDYIDETCKKHDIPYFLSYGTMLGAGPSHGPYCPQHGSRLHA